jgi:hypothetical protein
MLRSVALVALTGCSVLVVRGAPDPAPPPPVHCTTSPFGPVVDTMFTVGTAAGALYFASTDNSLGATVEAGFAIAFGLSAIYGWRKIGHCQDLQPSTP